MIAAVIVTALAHVAVQKAGGEIVECLLSIDVGGERVCGCALVGMGLIGSSSSA